MPELPGDPNCICQGTGLTCRLLDGGPDPSSIAICDCVLDKLARAEKAEAALAEERERVRKALLDHDVQNRIAEAIGRLERDEITADDMAEEMFAALDSTKGTDYTEEGGS